MSFKENQQEILKKSAQEIIDNLPENSRISFLTNNNSYEKIDQKTLKNILIKIDYTSQYQNLNSIFTKINRISNNETNNLNKVFLISDFQNIKYKNKTNVTNVNTSFSLIDVASRQFSNSYIDSVYVSDQNNSTITLKVISKNINTKNKNISISLFNDEKLIGKTTTLFQENIKNEVEFKFPIQKKINGKITLNDENLTFDNTLYFTLKKPNKIRVLSIGKPSSFLPKIYTQNEFYFEHMEAREIDFNKITNQHLIVLNEINQISNPLQHSISKFVKKGGTIAIIPSEKIDVKSYSQLFLNLNLGNISNATSPETLKVTTINYDHPLLKNVFERKVHNFEYPTTKIHHKVNLINNSKIISLENKSGFINEIKSGKGIVYWLQSPLNIRNSNFQLSPLIVPVFYNIGTYSHEFPQLYYTIGKENTIEVDTVLDDNEILNLSSISGNFIPLQQVFEKKVKITTLERPDFSGFYNINNKNVSISTIAFNNDRQESNLNHINVEDIFKNVKNINVSNSIKKTFTDLNNQQQIKSLFKWFLTLTILFLLLEICILKFYRA